MRCQIAEGSLRTKSPMRSRLPIEIHHADAQPTHHWGPSTTCVARFELRPILGVRSHTLENGAKAWIVIVNNRDLRNLTYSVMSTMVKS